MEKTHKRVACRYQPVGEVCAWACDHLRGNFPSFSLGRKLSPLDLFGRVESSDKTRVQQLHVPCHGSGV